MATVIGVRFKKSGKVYYFDPTDIWPRPGDCVVVETTRGMEFGEVVTGSRSVSDQQIVTPLKKVIRVANEEDVHRAEANEKREREAFEVCQERIAKHKVPRYFRFVDAFPMNAAGKILKYKMREEAVELLKLQDAEKIVTA